MKSWRIVAVLLLFLALAGFTACIGGGNKEEATQQLVKVVPGDLIISVSGSGSIAVSNEVNLTFGTSGRVDKIYVDEGDKVSEGEVLAKLDTDALELALTQAELALETARYNLDKAENPYTPKEIRDARDAVDDAEDYLDYAKDTLAQASDNETIREWKIEVYHAQMSLDTAEDKLDDMLSAPDQDEIEIKEMQVDAAEQTLAEAQKQLDEATITAPFDGIVASVDADEGDTVSTATTIVYLIDLTTMELNAELDEIDIPSVELGQKAIIEVDALPDLSLEGEVISISPLPTVEAGVVVYATTIDFDVPQDSGLKVGMSATADIIINERSSVLLVPNRAIKQDRQGNPVVYVIVNEQIEKRSVVIGISNGFQTEIVGGLQEGETVVIELGAGSEPSGRPGFPFH